MITEIYLSTDNCLESFDNGLNIKINRCDDEEEVCFILVDNAEKQLMPSFEIPYRELVMAIEKLKFKEYTDEQ